MTSLAHRFGRPARTAATDRSSIAAVCWRYGWGKSSGWPSAPKPVKLAGSFVNGKLMQRYRYFWFLLSLIAMLILAPITDRLDIAITHQVLFTTVVLLALNTATDRRNHGVVAAVCAVSWLIMDWSSFLFGWPLLRVPAGIVFFCLLFVVLYDILMLLLHVRRTDFNLLSASVAAYFLLGVAWAASFEVIERVMPGSFHGLDPQQWSEFLYFSMTTLTTLGYGDITPANPIAGIWAAIEAACGVLYVAVLISHLVSRVRG